MSGTMGELQDFPVLLAVAASALQHSVLAIRKAAAQLFVSAVASPHHPDPAYAAAAAQAARRVVQGACDVLCAETAAAGAPRFEAFACGSTFMCDPKALWEHQVGW